MIRAAAFAILIVLPTGAASGAIDAGLVAAHIDNGHTQDCVESATGLCLASSTGENVGDREVAAQQRFHSLIILLNGSAVNDVVGLEVLPGREIVLRAEDTVLPNPVSPILDEHGGGGVFLPAPLGAYGVVANDTTYGIRYYGPWPTEPTNVSDQGFGTQYSEEGGVGYSHVGPFNLIVDRSTDDHAHGVLSWACEDPDGGTCTGGVSSPFRQYQGASPNLVAGFLFEQATVATDPSALAPAASLAARDTPAEPLGARAAVPEVAPTRTPVAPANAPRLSDERTTTPGPRAPAPPQASLPPAPRVDAMAAAPAAPEDAGVPPLVTIAASFTLAAILAFLYSRIRNREDAMRSERRAQLVALLERRGPLPIMTLAKELGLDRSTVQHHARLLVRTTQAELIRRGGKLWLALQGQALALHAGFDPNASAKAILDAIEASGGAVTREQLRDQLAHVPARTRNHEIKRLVARGLVQRVQPAELLVIPAPRRSPERT